MIELYTGIKGRFYDKEKNEICLVAPVEHPNYYFILFIPDINLYRTIRNMVFENKNKLIIVAGEWNLSKEDRRIIRSIIYSNKQITII